MIVNPSVVVNIRIARLDFPKGEIVYIATTDDHYVAGGWRELQEWISSILIANTIAGLPVANINFGS